MYNKLFTKVNKIGQGLDHNVMSYDFSDLSVPNHLLFRAFYDKFSNGIIARCVQSRKLGGIFRK